MEWNGMSETKCNGMECNAMQWQKNESFKSSRLTKMNDWFKWSAMECNGTKWN
jgi:hypothetical protein